MKRGADESAIESMAEAADPVVLSKSGSGFIELQNYVLTINWFDYEQKNIRGEIANIFLYKKVKYEKKKKKSLF